MALHLSPDEQRLVAQALAEQRIRLGPQAEGEEKLLRRMTGSVTEYMDAAGLADRLDEHDRDLLTQHDGEQETNMEGMSWYLDVFLEWYEDSQRKTEHFMTGKTLSESGADLDRMFLISSAITKAFRGDSGVHARYMVVGGQSEPAETMSLNLSPDEQRLVTQALAEQRIRLGPQAEGEEKLLRRMVGNVTEYMDAAGLSNRLDEHDRALLAEHDGEPEAAPVMGGMQL